MIRISTVIAAVILLCAGCVAPNRDSNRTFELSLSPSGTCSFNRRVLRIDDLPRALKSAGAGKGSIIRVNIPDNIPTQTLRALTSRLASAGYSRVVFSKPRRAAVSVEKR